MGCSASNTKDVKKTQSKIPPEVFAQQADITKPDIDRLNELFDNVDVDGSGSIDQAELTNLFEQLGLNTDPAVVQSMITIVDDNKTGKLSKQEFYQVVYIISNIGGSCSVPRIMFLNADKDFSGTICEKEFNYICKHINYSDDDQKISEEFKSLCQEGHDVVNYHVFCYAVDNFLQQK